jgi:hypothetical protein
MGLKLHQYAVISRMPSHTCGYPLEPDGSVAENPSDDALRMSWEGCLGGLPSAGPDFLVVLGVVVAD